MSSSRTYPTFRENERGFTLIELLIVLSILSILAAVAVPSYIGMRSRAYDASARSDLAQARIAAHAHFVVEDTFSGLTVAQLRQYDGSIPDRLFIGTTTKGTYCIGTTVGSHTWSMSGPSSDVPTQAGCAGDAGGLASAGLEDTATADEAKPELTKEEQAKADEAKPDEALAEQAKAEEAKAEQAKAGDTKADDAKADDAKADDAKAGETKADDAKAEMTKEAEAEAKAEQAKAEQAAQAEKSK